MTAVTTENRDQGLMWRPRVEKGASRSGKDTLFLPTLKAPAGKKLADRPQSAIGPKSDAD